MNLFLVTNVLLAAVSILLMFATWRNIQLRKRIEPDFRITIHTHPEFPDFPQVIKITCENTTVPTKIYQGNSKLYSYVSLHKDFGHDIVMPTPEQYLNIIGKQKIAAYLMGNKVNLD